MPDKPTWYGRLEETIAHLEASGEAWVAASDLEQLLGVGRRRAQQILAPCVSRTLGRNGLATREMLIARLRSMAANDPAYYEGVRRKRLARELARLDLKWREQPKLLVESSAAVERRDLGDLPEGISVEAGRVVVEGSGAEQILERLLALAMAIGNDYERFEDVITHRSNT